MTVDVSRQHFDKIMVTLSPFKPMCIHENFKGALVIEARTQTENMVSRDYTNSRLARVPDYVFAVVQEWPGERKCAQLLFYRRAASITCVLD